MRKEVAAKSASEPVKRISKKRLKGLEDEEKGEKKRIDAF